MVSPRGFPGLIYVGVDLFFQPVARQVFSAQVSLTSVFGMGTGGPSPLKTPTVNGYCQILTYESPNVKSYFFCTLKTEQWGEEGGGRHPCIM